MRIHPIATMLKSDNTYIHRLGGYFAYLWQYRSVYCLMVRNDLKKRFNSTILGYFWHLLYPLSQIIIYYAIFSMIFGNNIQNYWVYMSIGIFAFTFFMSSTSGNSLSIVSNSGMVTKMALAREIIIFSKVTVNLITLVISYAVLAIILLFSEIGISINLLYLPVIIISFTIFNTGLGLLLSSVTVYIRDISNAVGILFGCLLFATPVIYMSDAVNNEYVELFWTINPLFYYVETLHDVFYWGIIPDLTQLLVCIVIAPLMFIIGLYVFKKLEYGFAERL